MPQIYGIFKCDSTILSAETDDIPLTIKLDNVNKKYYNKEILVSKRCGPLTFRLVAKSDQVHFLMAFELLEVSSTSHIRILKIDNFTLTIDL